jgi:hypothetical protein
MNRFALKPLQLIVLIILGVVGGLYWYAGNQQQRYDAAATRYLQSAFADIGSWQRAALQRQLAEEARRTLSDEQLDAIVERYRALGAFAQLGDMEFSRLTPALSLLGRNRLLSYHGSAQFQHGNANFTATLLIYGDQFRLYNLSFSAPQLNGLQANGLSAP